jgi:hypothetical protein
VGEVNRLADALKTIIGICKFYGVRDYTPLEEGRIAVYNVPKDNFHFFRWDCDKCQYVYAGSEDYVSNWLERRIAVL